MAFFFGRGARVVEDALRAVAGFRALRRVLALLVRVRVPLPVVLAEVRVPGTICIDEERALAGRGAMRERRGAGAGGGWPVF